MSALRKISRGCYEHRPTGRLVIHTSGWEGPRGGDRSAWEHGRLINDEIVVEGMDLFRTRREAVNALDKAVSA